MPSPSELLKDNIKFAINSKMKFLRDAKQLKTFNIVAYIFSNCYLCGGCLYMVAMVVQHQIPSIWLQNL
jgi:hypothetical protein